MYVKVIATTQFVHGKWNLSKGEKESIPESIAKDLIAAGLVVLDTGEAKVAPKAKDKMAPKLSNKAAQGGTKAAESIAATLAPEKPTEAATGLESALGQVDTGSALLTPPPGLNGSADVCTTPSGGDTSDAV